MLGQQADNYPLPLPLQLFGMHYYSLLASFYLSFLAQSNGHLVYPI